jgi:hypothetical protein
MTDKLAQKIAKAALDVGGKLNPDKRNNEQRYDYLSADKILSVCGQALFTQGVVVVPEIVAQETAPFEYTDQYGKSKRRYDSRVDFVFHITDGEDTNERRWYGMGSDYTVPDKALYKAITSGHKYFLMKLLCVGAGNEDSEHEDAPQPAARQQAQRPPLPDIAPPPDDFPDIPEEHGLTLEDAKARLTPKGARYDSLADDQLAVILASKNADARVAAALILNSRGVQVAA